MTFSRTIFLSLLASMSLLGLSRPTYAQRSVSACDGMPAIEVRLAKFGGRILPYYLPDLLRYVDDDEVRVRKYLTELKMDLEEIEKEKIPGEKIAKEKLLKEKIANLTNLLPRHSELGRLIRVVHDNHEKQLEILCRKTVVFSSDALTDVNFEDALRVLEPISDQVIKVDLSYSAVIGAPLQHLANLKQLTDLDLSASPLTCEGWKAIDGLNRVSRLWLCGTTITVSDFKNLLKEFSGRIELLSLSNLTVTDPHFKLSDKALKDLRKANVPEAMLTKLNPLKDKELPQEDFKNEIDRYLVLEERQQFEYRILTHAKTDRENKIDADAWVHDMASMNQLFPAGLKSLSLAGNKLTNLNLTDLNAFKKLEGLDLADNPEVTDDKLKLLKFSLLKELSLSGTGQPKNGGAAVTDTGVFNLLNSNITQLNLAGTATLADPKSKLIGVIRQMKDLATLNVSGTAIDDSGLWNIWGSAKDGQRLDWLVSLDISNTGITDTGLVGENDVVGFPRLKIIRSGATDLKITAGGVGRRNAFVAKEYTGKKFNLAKLVKSP